MKKSDTHARISDGRTDLVFDFVAAGNAANTTKDGVSLMETCAYFGDVSAIRFLLSHGETLQSLGEDMGLIGAAFHGHWRLCQFLLENGADANYAMDDTGETPLHSCLCRLNDPAATRIVKVLLAAGADPNAVTIAGVETGGFMRDTRTKGETPLHRAAAFGEGEAIHALLDAGAQIDARDVNGDSPLGWGSWYLRPDTILRMLCFGDFRIREGRSTMSLYLLGTPHV